jgi:hypothetical protein
VKETERAESRGGHGHGSEMRRARGGCQQSCLNSDNIVTVQMSGVASFQTNKQLMDQRIRQ